MRERPKSVIHFDFLPDTLVFDTRPIWTALGRSVERGAVAASVDKKLREELGNSALHLATRHYLMERAICELNVSCQEIFQKAADPEHVRGEGPDGMLCGAETARDRALLATDSRLRNSRRHWEGAIKTCAPIVQTLRMTAKERHEFLLDLCVKLGVATEWYNFLNGHRNFFTHEGAPYCAIEDQLDQPNGFDLIIMKTNIVNFEEADPSDFFRISELQPIVTGITDLSRKVQDYLISLLG